MTTTGRAGVLALVVLAGTMATWASGPDVPELSGTPADPETIAQALQETRVDTRPPEPSLREWFQAVMDRAMVALLDALSPSPAARRLINRSASGLSLALVATALVMLATLLIRTWRQRLRNATASEVDRIEGLPLAGTAPETAQGWWGALERALAAGRVAEGVAALWWFVATALVGPAVEPSWTTSELVERSGRRDLARLLRRLDALAFGPRPPDEAQVRRLASELKDAVA